MDFRNDTLGCGVVFSFGGVVEGFFPAGGAETPFATGCEPDLAEVVAFGGGEIEEGVC
jgi:hypothetical protein